MIKTGSTKRQIQAGGVGFSAAVLIGWVLGEYGLAMPDAVMVALGSVIQQIGAFLIGYLED